MDSCLVLTNTLSGFLGTLLECAVLVCAFKKNALRRYGLLNVYMAASVLVSIGRYNILSHYGFTSKEYLYFYYYSDSPAYHCSLFCLGEPLFPHFR